MLKRGIRRCSRTGIWKPESLFVCWLLNWSIQGQRVRQRMKNAELAKTIFGCFLGALFIKPRELHQSLSALLIAAHLVERPGT